MHSAGPRSCSRAAPGQAGASARGASAAAAPAAAPAAAAYPVSQLNAAVAPARPGEVPPLLLPPLPPLAAPLLLAPMAGITSAPLRRICAEHGAAVCVSEMILAHELVAGSAKTRHLAAFHEDESPRSAQLYVGVYGGASAPVKYPNF